MPPTTRLDIHPPKPQAGAALLGGWSELWLRMQWRFWLKLLGVSGFTWLFFLGYFHTLRHPVRPVFEMPLTALDHAISAQPAMLAAYVSLWVYVGIPTGLLLSLREMIIHGLWAAAMCAVGLLCFYLVPTAVPRPDALADLAQHTGFALLQGVDAAGNACPSMHVASALFSAVWIDRMLRDMGRALRPLRLLNVTWLLLIVYSTLAIKQHVAYDVLGGAVLGLVFAVLSLRWFPRSATWPAGGGR